MNCSFSAFGALVGLLALAMFSVSSSSRSTTVRAPRPDESRAAAGGSLRQTNLVAALRVSSTDNDCGAEGCCPAESEQAGCGMAGALADLTMLPTSRNWNRRPMTPTRVAVAENANSRWPAPAPLVDCRSHYDAYYDRLIYGVADDDFPQGPRITDKPIDEPASLATDWLTDFQALVAPHRNASPQPQAGASTRGGWSGWSAWTSAVMVVAAWRDVEVECRDDCVTCDEEGCGLDAMQLQLAVTTFGGRLKQRAERLVQGVKLYEAVGSAVGVGFEEYAALHHRVKARAGASAVSKRTSGMPASVRSSGWLRHSAASSLYQMGLLLQAAGTELDRMGETNSASKAFGLPVWLDAPGGGR